MVVVESLPSEYLMWDEDQGLSLGLEADVFLANESNSPDCQAILALLHHSCTEHLTNLGATANSCSLLHIPTALAACDLQL